MANEVDLDTETDQQLVDRLVHAAEEEDLLYVEVCVRRLLERGVMDAVMRQHSWKGVSALILVATTPHSKLRQLIFQVLLLRLNTSIRSAFSGFSVQSWSKSIIVLWEGHGRRTARQAVEIFSLSDESAVAGWLDTAVSAGDLPDPPDPQSLTGCGPLPPRPLPPLQAPPPPTPLSPARPLHLRSSDVPTIQAQHHLPLPPASNPVNGLMLPTPGKMYPTEGGGRTPGHTNPANNFLLPPVLPHTAPSPPLPSVYDDHPIRIRIGNLPLEFTSKQVYTLFANARLTIRDVRMAATARNTSVDAYGTLPNRAAWHSAVAGIKRLSGGRRLYIYRDRPDFNTEPEDRYRHPLVIVEGLPADTTVKQVTRLARDTRCGSYEVRATQMEDAGSTFTRGSFRTSSPVAASEAVQYLNGLVKGGRRMTARWEHSPAVLAEAAGQSPSTTPSAVRGDSNFASRSAPPSYPTQQPTRKAGVNLFSALLPKPSITNSTYPPASSSAHPIDPTPSPIDFSPTAAVGASPPPPYSSAPPRAAYNPPFLSSSTSAFPSSAPAPPPSFQAANPPNPFGGILSAPFASTASSSSPSDLPLLDKIPPRSTPSPFLPGCAPASKRSAKRKVDEAEGQRETDAKGGEGERGKVRKVSFAE